MSGPLIVIRATTALCAAAVVARLTARRDKRY